MTAANQIEAKYPIVRSLQRWQNSATHYAGAAQFTKVTALSKGVHTVVEQDLPIDLFADIRRGQPLAIIFNGRTVRTPEVKLPVFGGFGVLPTTAGVSRLCINDPSLYLAPDLALGWYAGSRLLKLQAILPKLIATVVRIARPSRVLFIGGSGGGFASLYYSRLVSGSLAAVWNPQTNILKYEAGAVARYASAAFGISTLDQAEQQLPALIDVDVAPCYVTPPGNFVLYLQNESDWHVEKHMKPFLAGAGQPTPVPGLVRPDLYLHMGNWGNGHAVPSKEFMASLFGALASYQPGWKSLFESGDLPRILKNAG